MGKYKSLRNKRVVILFAEMASGKAYRISNRRRGTFRGDYDRVELGKRRAEKMPVFNAVILLTLGKTAHLINLKRKDSEKIEKGENNAWGEAQWNRQKSE